MALQIYLWTQFRCPDAQDTSRVLNVTRKLPLIKFSYQNTRIDRLQYECFEICIRQPLDELDLKAPPLHFLNIDLWWLLLGQIQGLMAVYCPLKHMTHHRATREWAGCGADTDVTRAHCSNLLLHVVWLCCSVLGSSSLNHFDPWHFNYLNGTITCSYYRKVTCSSSPAVTPYSVAPVDDAILWSLKLLACVYWLQQTTQSLKKRPVGSRQTYIHPPSSQGDTCV